MVTSKLDLSFIFVYRIINSWFMFEYKHELMEFTGFLTKLEAHILYTSNLKCLRCLILINKQYYNLYLYNKYSICNIHYLMIIMNKL